MKTTKIQSIQGGSGFNFYGKVVDIKKHGDRDALVVEKISGADPGKQFIVVQKEDPDYRGYKFDSEGLIALKIKKGSTIGLSEGQYVDKNAEPAVVEVRRASKVGRDFRAEQALAVAAYGAAMNRLNGYILTPKGGIHGKADENKQEVIADLIGKTLPKLSDTQGLMIVVNGKDDEGNGITVHRTLSRYAKENSDAPAVVMPLDAFQKKIGEFMESGTMINFLGKAQVDLADVFASSNPINIAVVPSESILLTGAKFLDNGKRAVNTGIGSIGVGIDPPNAERGYPIMQIGAMEMAQLVGFRRKGPNGEKYAGEKVVQQQDDFIFNRLSRQIDLLNGINPDMNLTTTGAATPSAGKPEVGQGGAASQAATESAAQSGQQEDLDFDSMNFDEDDPFNFSEEDTVGLGF
jgi:hypothetical protein